MSHRFGLMRFCSEKCKTEYMARLEAETLRKGPDSALDKI
jgi:hypothetical protein